MILTIKSGSIEETNEEEWQQQYATNVFGVVNLTKSFLPYFRRSGGTICTVSSLVGLLSIGMLSVYGSSKHANEGIMEGLDQEFKAAGLPIKVLIIEPGAFKTKFNNNTFGAKNEIEDYKPARVQIAEFFKTKFNEIGGNAKIGASRMADALLGEGMVAGKEIPLRLALGGDSVDEPIRKFTDLIQTRQDWREFSTSSDPKR